MSTDLQSAVEFIVRANYVSLAIITAVAYDYVLTFSREIEYIWCRPWTSVSTMFVVVRYVGLCWITTSALAASTFVPDHPVSDRRRVVVLSTYWTSIVFLSAANLVMILRVYAIWNRSRTILYILLFIYILTIITAIVLDGIYDNPNTYLPVRIFQILDFSLCTRSLANVLPSMYIVASQLVLNAVLMFLVVFQTLKQSFEVYKATKQWQSNRYMQQLLRDGILYFVVNVVNDVLGLARDPIYNASFFLDTFVLISFSTLVPRFIIGIRELYDRDIHGRFDIDTGFGVLSQSNAGADTTVSAILFIDGNQGPEVEGSTDDLGDLETGRL